MIASSHWVAGAAQVTLVLLVAGMVLSFVRILKGPETADRVAALDLVCILVVAFLAAFSIVSEEPAFLDVAIAYALISFLGTVALARYTERRKGKD